jgi:hypothetical protein
MNRLLLFIIVIFIGTFSLNIARAQTGVTLQPCSDSVHSGYRTIGPDTLYYPTWHPVVDITNNCYHDHDHGSAPHLAAPGVGWNNTAWPAFGYTAARDGMSEPHNGFKVYVYQSGGVLWTILHHFGTGNAAGAACVQFHTFDIQARNPVSGALYADVHLMADHGQSQINSTNAPLTPSGCPDNPQRSDNGARLFPVMTAGNVGYEPWRVASGTNVFGFNSRLFTVNTADPVTACDTDLCAVNVARSNIYGPARGQYRFITLNNGGVMFSTNHPPGVFYTDPLGTTILGGEESNAVRQYIADGWSFAGGQATHCFPYGHDMLYVCDESVPQDTLQYVRNVFIGSNN